MADGVVVLSRAFSPLCADGPLFSKALNMKIQQTSIWLDEHEINTLFTFCAV